MGQKPPKKPAKARKPLAKASAKKRAKKATEAAHGAREHMARIAAMPCLVCGAWPVELHHEGKPRSDWHVIPLCPRHHRREYGPGSYHYSPKAFYAMHGLRADLLSRYGQKNTPGE